MNAVLLEYRVTSSDDHANLLKATTVGRVVFVLKKAVGKKKADSFDEASDDL